MRAFWCVLLVGICYAGALAQQAPIVVSLDAYGPIATPAQADAALEKATAALVAAGGGVLLIPATAPAGWRAENTAQGAWRKPEPPAPAKSWGYGAAITVVDARGGSLNVAVPQMSGMGFQRVLRLPEGQSAPADAFLPMMTFTNSLVRGTTSYHDWVVAGVKAGKDARIYVHTIRGLFPGMFINTLGGNMNRLYVKSLGYDKDKRLPYIVADVDADIAEFALLSNKTHANLLRADTYSHTENQTFDVMLLREHYTQGDAGMFYAGFNYMGDVHSTAGDENGVLFAAFPISMSNSFRGAVATYTPATGDLVYTGGSNAHTLASGRPMINMNPKKWITAGSAHLVHPGGALIGYADRVRSYDAPWTPEVVGRYLAIDEPDEYVPGSNGARRWYYIAGFNEDADSGLKWLSIQRNWWGAKNGSSITRLYNPAHYTVGMTKADARPLKYIIAPGANVYDVSRGVRDDGPWGGRFIAGALDRLVKLSPGPHLNTAFDFQPGDPIEQATGFDPFKPIPFRSWQFEKVPSVAPMPVFDVQNRGATQRYSVMVVNGGSGRYADYTAPGKPLPQLPFNKIMDLQSASNRGIAFTADVAKAALVFRQPGQTQFIRWNNSADWSVPLANMSVNAQGVLELGWRVRGYKGDPGGVDMAGQSISDITGIGGNATAQFYPVGNAGAAANFRGVKVPVPVGATSFAVTFRIPEKDGAYAVTISPSWMTDHLVADRTAKGFQIRFSAPAPQGATVDWVMVR